MKQYVYLKTGLEKTGDSIKSNSRLKAAKYFADKKRIPLKLWLNIYVVLPDGNFKTDKTYRFENKTTTLYYGYKVSINKIVLLKSIEKNPNIDSEYIHNKLSINRFLKYKKFLINTGWEYKEY